MELLERELGRLEGVRSAKVRSPELKDRWYYELEVLEGKPLRPSRLRELEKKLVIYPLVSLTARDLEGTVGRREGKTVLEAGGTRYVLEGAEALEEGAKVKLTGSVTEKEGVLHLKVKTP